jgi:hypothetical protein
MMKMKEMMMTSDIFIPILYDVTGIYMISLRTFDRPLRYFDDPDSPLLNNFWRVIGKKHKTSVKDGDPVVMGESYQWGLKYVFIKSKNISYVKEWKEFQCTQLKNMTDVFSLEMPAELQIALLSIIATELGEKEVVKAEAPKIRRPVIVDTTI